MYSKWLGELNLSGLMSCCLFLQAMVISFTTMPCSYNHYFFFFYKKQNGKSLKHFAKPIFTVLGERVPTLWSVEAGEYEIQHGDSLIELINSYHMDGVHVGQYIYFWCDKNSKVLSNCFESFEHIHTVELLVVQHIFWFFCRFVVCYDDVIKSENL